MDTEFRHVSCKGCCFCVLCPTEVRDLVDAKDFAASAFKVAIARSQQAALDQSKMSVPDPARQLELLSAKRKTRNRGAPANLSLFNSKPVQVKKQARDTCITYYCIHLRNYRVHTLEQAKDC